MSRNNWNYWRFRASSTVTGLKAQTPPLLSFTTSRVSERRSDLRLLKAALTSPSAGRRKEAKANRLHLTSNSARCAWLSGTLAQNCDQRAQTRPLTRALTVRGGT